MKKSTKGNSKEKRNSRRIGFAIEEAGKYLEEKRYRIVCRNFFSRYGEIDIVACNKDVLVFVEVRYRKHGPLVSPVESVDFRKLQGLRLAIRE